jgi:uncharacterized membrane protein
MAAEVLIVAFLLVAPDIAPFKPAAAAAATLAAFVFPGYAVASAILPRRLSFIERTVISLGTGLVSSVALALILSALPWGLGQLQWMTALALLTIVAGIAAVLEREPTTRHPSMLAPLKAGNVVTIGLFTLAAAISLGAIGLRVAGGPPDSPGFTQLWALPVGTASARMIEVGVANAEGHSTDYRLEIVVGRQAQQEFRFTLASGQEWSRRLDFTSGGAQEGEALLYRVPASAPYRRVDLRLSSQVPAPSPRASAP